MNTFNYTNRCVRSQSLRASSMCICHLLEVAQSTPEWTGTKEGGQQHGTR